MKLTKKIFRFLLLITRLARMIKWFAFYSVLEMYLNHSWKKRKKTRTFRTFGEIFMNCECFWLKLDFPVNFIQWVRTLFAWQPATLSFYYCRVREMFEEKNSLEFRFFLCVFSLWFVLQLKRECFITQFTICYGLHITVNEL